MDHGRCLGRCLGRFLGRRDAGGVGGAVEQRHNRGAINDTGRDLGHPIWPWASLQERHGGLEAVVDADVTVVVVSMWEEGWRCGTVGRWGRRPSL